MSERERWIVYPLLMFALGAAVRDKLMQRVETEVIRCASLQIVDKQNPDITLAELGFTEANANDPSQLSERVGSLQLRDGKGNTVCNINNDILAGRLVARQLLVVDPQFRPLVIAATEAQPTFSLRDTDPPVSYRGVIYLNNQSLQARPAQAVNRADNPQPPPQSAE